MYAQAGSIIVIVTMHAHWEKLSMWKFSKNNEKKCCHNRMRFVLFIIVAVVSFQLKRIKSDKRETKRRVLSPEIEMNDRF